MYTHIYTHPHAYAYAYIHTYRGTSDTLIRVHKHTGALLTLLHVPGVAADRAGLRMPARRRDAGVSV